MPKTPKEDTYEIPDSILKQGVVDVRTKFFVDFEKEKDYYDLDFVEKIRVDDTLLERYIWHQSGNVDKAVDQIKLTTKWRKEFGANDLTKSSLNQDIYKASLLYPNKWDRLGHPILMLVVNRATRNAETNRDKQKIIIYWAEKILKKAKECKLTFFIDCQNVGFSNMDLEMMVFITTALINYYPNCLGNVLVYNMPRLFNVIWQVVKSILSKQYRPKVKFVNKESVIEYVKPEFLPRRMGGQVPDFYDYEKMEDYDEE